MQFVKTHLEWSGDPGIKKWRNTIWSDETKVNLFGSDGHQYVRRPKNEEYRSKYMKKKTIKHGGNDIKLWR